MHTLRLTLIGLILSSLFIFVATQLNRRKNKEPIDGGRIFIWFWLAVSLINFYIGVFVAHYSVATEIGVHLVIFGLPAGVAWYLSRRFRAKAKPAGE
jgi:uncharacterized membrane protein